MSTSITIMCENCTEKTGTIGENGFSALIETEENSYLFDTGPGLSLPHNTKALKKDLSRVDKIILSHGHRDHTGGIEWAVHQMTSVEVVASTHVFSLHMVNKPENAGAPPKPIHCPMSPAELRATGATLRLADTTTKIATGIHFITGVKRKKNLTPSDPRCVLPEVGSDSFTLDPILDDASLLIEGSHPPVLLLGCAHSGLLNILEHLEKEMGVTKLGAILGGTHLMHYGTEMLSQIIDRLEDFSVDLVAACHCTGFYAAAFLSNHFGKRFSKSSVGSVYRFGS
jgi:7,8-dihydropterin-6-yl-methyl-4-(beta-D-ribofuranosyl)aminobenzene 5'-phosphate synthase